jgi:hypothetical protein
LGSAGHVETLRSWWAGFGSTEGSRAGHGFAATADVLHSTSAAPTAFLRRNVTEGFISLARRMCTQGDVENDVLQCNARHPMGEATGRTEISRARRAALDSCGPRPST